MSKRLAGLLTAGLFVLSVTILLGPGASPVSAQGKSGTVVIHASRHDQHALGPDDALPYAGGKAAGNHEMVLRHAHAPGIVKQMQDSALQTSTGPTVATSSGVDFGGVGANGYAPPDTNGAAGATQYMQWVNVRFAVYNKSDGSLVYGPVSGNSIWSGFGGSCQSSNSGDPIAQYDKQAGRWVVMQPVFSSPYSICVAVSTTSTWSSNGITWNRYQFNVPNNSSNLPDYPKLSVWPDGYYLSYNSFTNGNSWAGPQACVMDRSAMLAGQAATMQCATAPGTNLNIDSWLPSDLDGDVPGVTGTTQAPPAGSPAYYVGIYAPDNTKLALFKYHVDWTTPSNSTFTGPTLISVSGFNEACGGGTCIPQPNTNQKLDSLADRLMYRLAYRNFGDHESLVVSQSVDPGNGTSGIRWYEIRSPGSSPIVYQQGTFAPDSSYRWMPSIAMDKVGDIAVGYSESSTLVAPSIYFTGQQAGDPLGTMESEAPLLQGAFSQTNGLSRWGDYSSMSVDPSDDCTFWYTNEYLPSNGTFNWVTRIASFVFPGCSNPSGSSFTLTNSSATQTVTAGNSATFDYLTLAPNNGFSGDVTIGISGEPSGVTLSSPTSVNVTTATNFSLVLATAAGTTAGTYNITVTGTSGSLNSSTTVTLVVNSSGPPPSFDLSAASGTLVVPVNSSNSDSLTVTPSNGFTGSVSLSLSGLPRWTSSSFSTNPVSITGAGSGSSTLTISTNRHAQQGHYSLMITATSGSLTSQIPLTLYIGTGPTGDFSLSSSPSSQTVVQGSGTSYGVTVTGSGGFSGSVGFSVSGLPNGANASFSPSTVSGSGTTTMSVTTSASTPAGTYPLTITGSSGSLSHTTGVTLVVNVSSTPDFSLSASPSSQTVVQGLGTNYGVSVSASGGFSGTVGFSVSGLPSGAGATFSPTSITTSGSTTMAVTTGSSTPTGTYTLTITGTSGSLTHTSTVTLVVSAPGSGDFSISASPGNVTLKGNGTATYTVSISPSGGFAGDVGLTVTGVSGATFSPSTVTGGSGSSTLSVSGASKGNYSLTITGTSGSLTHSTSVSLKVH
ncbi:MAG TPA: hypothetical protein VMW54_14040 [Terriglobia bacterium]|nr:hypothetical protein [Terriglobia bacterium]